MPIRSILRNHRELEISIEEIIKYGLDLMKQKSIFINDKEKTIVIEGILLRSCAYWEKFLVKELIYLIDRDQTKIKKQLEISFSEKIDRHIIKAILFSDSYRSFHDIERSKGFFRLYIENRYNLFNKINNEQIKKCKMVYALRNYLVHYSDFAKKKLKQEYKDSYNYTRFMKPGIFLRKDNGKHFEKLIHNFSIMSSTMRKDIS